MKGPVALPGMKQGFLPGHSPVKQSVSSPRTVRESGMAVAEAAGGAAKSRSQSEPASNSSAVSESGMLVAEAAGGAVKSRSQSLAASNSSAVRPHPRYKPLSLSKMGGGGTKCSQCSTTVYKLEQFVLDGNKMHKRCFKCGQCKMQVRLICASKFVLL